MNDNMRNRIKASLYEVTDELSKLHSNNILHGIEAIEGLARISRFKGILDVQSNRNWLIPEVYPVFKFNYDLPGISKEEQEKYSRGVFEIDAINKYIQEYIFELDSTENGDYNLKLDNGLIEARANPEDNDLEKVNLKKVVPKTIEELGIKDIVLEELPKKEQRPGNRRWKLSPTQLYNLYFSKKYPTAKDKVTIMRYIKKFRSEQQ